MTTQNQIRTPSSFADEGYYKVFIVVGENAQKCAVCNQLYTRQEAYEHSKVTCYPWSQSC